jgi:predicted nucleic acid-binding protein
MICLDNSVLRRFASPNPSPGVDAYLKANASVPWVIPATVAFEYYVFYDTQADIRTQQRLLNSRLDGILPLTDEVASEAAQLQTLFDEHDIALDLADLLHVATARDAGATFVTRDAGDFDKQPLRDLLSIDIIDS